MVNVMRLYQGGGMGGSSHLPDDVMEQPVAMIEALNIMVDFDARQREKDAEPMTEDGETDYSAKMAAAAASIRAHAKKSRKPDAHQRG